MFIGEFGEELEKNGKLGLGSLKEEVYGVFTLHGKRRA